MSKTPTEMLRLSLDACDGAGNDHDHICECRPVDVRRVLEEVERLRHYEACTGEPGCTCYAHVRDEIERLRADREERLELGKEMQRRLNREIE